MLDFMKKYKCIIITCRSRIGVFNILFSSSVLLSKMRVFLPNYRI